jgi:hypothetical protein
MAVGGILAVLVIGFSLRSCIAGPASSGQRREAADRQAVDQARDFARAVQVLFDAGSLTSAAIETIPIATARRSVGISGYPRPNVVTFEESVKYATPPAPFGNIVDHCYRETLTSSVRGSGSTYTLEEIDCREMNPSLIP